MPTASDSEITPTILFDVMPRDGWNDILEKHGNLGVIAEFDGTEECFPQKNRTHRYVHKWWLMEDGSVIGWNESPRDGWAFPRLGGKAVVRFYQSHAVDMPAVIETQLKKKGFL